MKFIVDVGLKLAVTASVVIDAKDKADAERKSKSFSSIGILTIIDHENGEVNRMGGDCLLEQMMAHPENFSGLTLEDVQTTVIDDEDAIRFQLEMEAEYSASRRG